MINESSDLEKIPAEGIQTLNRRLSPEEHWEMVERGDPRSGRWCLAGLFSRGQRWSLTIAGACSRRLDQPAEAAGSTAVGSTGRERRLSNWRIGGGSSWVNRW